MTKRSGIAAITGYPPFVALALFLVRNKDAARAGSVAQELRKHLNRGES